MQNWKIYSSLNVKMMRYKCQINFLFVFYVIIQVNFSILQKREESVMLFLKEERCMITNCCDDFPKLPNGIVCKKVLYHPPYSYYIFEFTDFKDLPARVFQGIHIRHIYIFDPGVTVDSNVLDGISALSEFYVQRSSIKAIPDFKFVKDSIWRINITSSLLTALEGGNLQNLTRLHTLSLSNNSIHSIDPNVFKGTVNVGILDLSYNLLTFIPETLLDPMKFLIVFQASYNNLLHVNNMFTVTRPEFILLMNNNITDISSALQFNFEKDEIRGREMIYKCLDDKDNRHFNPLFSIRLLHLGSNSIKETSQSIFSCLRSFPYNSSSLLEIHDFKLHENNIRNLNFLLRYLIINRLEVFKNQIEYLTDDDFKYTAGIDHLELWGNNIKRIDTETFRRQRSHLQYLDMSWNLITSLNGSMRFLLHLRTLKLGRNSIKIPTSDLLPIYIINRNDEDFIKNITSYTFHIEDKILGISLENNSLESLDTTQLPPNLIQLYLSENKLRRLPKSILGNQLNLKQVTLSGNPWKCDCDAINFKKWLTSKKEKIKDIDNVRCGIIGNEDSRLNGRVIINLTDLELCPTDIVLIVLAPSGTLTVIIFFLVSKILYTRYKLNIKVFLYSHGITLVREEDLDYNKTFDAFISFSHDDDEFVINEIISVIEKRNPNIHLCFHIRDFIPGELITTNITRAVQNSKKTVLILSKNFLESEWCLLEARTAHSQVMEDKVHRIIVIKVGDLPKEMDPLIKAYLVSTTYITWGESTFWNKLLYVLPSHVSEERTVPDNMENNEFVL